MNQPHESGRIHTSLPSHIPHCPTPLGCHRALVWVPWIIQQIPIGYFTYDSVYVAAAAAKSLQSCPTLCNPIDGSSPGSSVPGILQARTLEWVAISFSNAWKGKVKVKSLSRVWLLVTPMDCSLPGSSVRGIFQARVLEWGAIAFSYMLEVFKYVRQCFTSTFWRFVSLKFALWIYILNRKHTGFCFVLG